ncbi:MAG: hypothetical protein ABSD38_29220 [Syntrophorhabdales bacterium]|jgi:hypothetical protein
MKTLSFVGDVDALLGMNTQSKIDQGWFYHSRDGLKRLSQVGVEDPHQALEWFASDPGRACLLPKSLRDWWARESGRARDQFGQGNVQEEPSKDVEASGNPTMTKDERNCVFWHSVDFRDVTSIAGTSFRLTRTQAAVVHVLYDASQTKFPYLSQDTILSSAATILDRIDHGKYVKDLFKRRNHDALKELFERDNYGRIRLKV